MGQSLHIAARANSKSFLHSLVYMFINSLNIFNIRIKHKVLRTTFVVVVVAFVNPRPVVRKHQLDGFDRVPRRPNSEGLDCQRLTLACLFPVEDPSVTAVSVVARSYGGYQTPRNFALQYGETRESGRERGREGKDAESRERWC